MSVLIALAALALLMLAAYRGYSVILFAPIAALGAVLLTDPGAVGAGVSTRPLPPTLLHAVEEFEGDPVITGVLDAAGDGVAAYSAGVKREEFFDYHSAVSPWEIDQYLTAF